MSFQNIRINYLFKISRDGFFPFLVSCML